MKLDKEFLAKKWKLPLTIRSHRRALAQLFPHENERSPTMWRLAIVRDDIDWENDNMRVAVEDAGADGSADALWRFAYFLRRVSVSVLEAKHVFDGEITKTLKRQARKYPHRKPLYVNIVTLVNKLNEIETLLEPFRNSLGAHIRPDDANPLKGTESYAVRGLRAHRDTQGEVEVNDDSQFGTSYREFTRLTFLFTWPEVVDTMTLIQKTNSFFGPVMEGTRHLLAAIDAVLHAFWLDIGAIERVK